MSLQQVRHAAQIAQWMHDRGQMVMEFDPDNDYDLYEDGGEYWAYATSDLKNKGLSLEDIQPGDLLFFAEKANGVYVEPLAYKNISHVAIVTKVNSFFTKIDEVKHAMYQHEIIEVVSKTMAFAEGGYEEAGSNYVQISNPLCDTMRKRNLWENPLNPGVRTDIKLAWGETLVMVCRPNLMQAGLDESLVAEAARLGLHTVPDSWGVLNVIKRARQFTDIKWSPANFLNRYSVKYWEDGPGQTPVYYDASFVPRIVYKGMPAAAIPSQRGDNLSKGQTKEKGDTKEPSVPYKAPGIDTSIDSFAYSVGIPGTINNDYGDIVTGWRFPSDLIRYAFGEVNDDFWNHNALPEFETEETSKAGLSLPSYNIPAGMDIRLGDVFDRRAIVTDLIKENGAITYVEVCMATREGCYNEDDVDGPYGGLAVRVMMSAYRFAATFLNSSNDAQ